MSDFIDDIRDGASGCGPIIFLLILLLVIGVFTFAYIVSMVLYEVIELAVCLAIASLVYNWAYHKYGYAESYVKIVLILALGTIVSCFNYLIFKETQNTNTNLSNPVIALISIPYGFGIAALATNLGEWNGDAFSRWHDAPGGKKAIIIGGLTVISLLAIFSALALLSME